MNFPKSKDVDQHRFSQQFLSMSNGIAPLQSSGWPLGHLGIVELETPCYENYMRCIMPQGSDSGDQHDSFISFVAWYLGCWLISSAMKVTSAGGPVIVLVCLHTAVFNSAVKTHTLLDGRGGWFRILGLFWCDCGAAWALQFHFQMEFWITSVSHNAWHTMHTCCRVALIS